jgi:hypothetical protein
MPKFMQDQTPSRFHPQALLNEKDAALVYSCRPSRSIASSSQSGESVKKFTDAVQRQARRPSVISGIAVPGLQKQATFGGREKSQWFEPNHRNLTLALQIEYAQPKKKKHFLIAGRFSIPSSTGKITTVVLQQKLLI